MAEYSNDDERLLAIGDFFKHYKSLILTILISISVIGISSYSIKSFNDSKAESASILYSEWMNEVSSEDSNILNDIPAFDELTENFSSTGFAQLAILKKASALAGDMQLEKSKNYFNQLQELSSGFFGNNLINKMSRVSLARILIAEANYIEALNSLETLIDESDPLVHELAGDALVGQEKNELAIEQYNLAKELYDDQASINIIMMKLNNI